MGSWMIYGANGYTGRLVAQRAVSAGHRPLLAGRSAAPVASLARDLDLSHRVFGLDDPASVEEALAGVDAVLHCAGPFSATSQPMVDACLASGTHYLDITGEIAVFEAVFARDGEARSAGVSLLPGVGFDVVPTDCLAAQLAARLPGAMDLDLAILGLGKISPGTTKTALEGISGGGAARVDGRIRKVPSAWRTRSVPYPSGARHAVSVPAGDISTAFRSTGIPGTTVYLALSRGAVKWMKASQALGPLLGSSPVQALLKGLVTRMVHGPTDEERKAGRTEVWGEARDEAGGSASGWVTMPEGYAFTAIAAMEATLRTAGGAVAPGAWTPAQAFGADFVDGLEGVVVSLL